MIADFSSKSMRRGVSLSRERKQRPFRLAFIQESCRQAREIAAKWKIKREVRAALRGRGMITDREFLCWIHERLEHIHGEKHLYDYMHKLRAIIAETPADRETPNKGQGTNSLEELRATWK